MVYSLIRGVLFSILVFAFFLGLFFIYFRPSVKHKALLTVALVFGAVFVFFFIYLAPLEDAWLTFPTAEEAYHYVCDEEIKFVVEGKESILYVTQPTGYRQNNFYIMGKTENGWKAPRILNSKRVSSRVLSNGSVAIYRYKNTQDYYLQAILYGRPSDLSDNRGTEFFCADGIPPEAEETLLSWCAYVPDVDENYTLFIKGQEISFFRQDRGAE